MTAFLMRRRRSRNMPVCCVAFQTDKAIEVYEAALKKNPRDGSLASKIGEALVKTHRYNKVGLSCSTLITTSLRQIY